MRPNEYIKTCPYCEKKFEAEHLSRAYCTERCKRRMYRQKKQEKRNIEEMEKMQYLKNNTLLARFYKPDLHPYEQKEILKAGFNQSYLKDRIRYENKMVVIFEDYYLEILADDKVIIHKKL